MAYSMAMSYLSVPPSMIGFFLVIGFLLYLAYRAAVPKPIPGILTTKVLIGPFLAMYFRYCRQQQRLEKHLIGSRRRPTNSIAP
jgi:hypothetical protein